MDIEQVYKFLADNHELSLGNLSIDSNVNKRSKLNTPRLSERLSMYTIDEDEENQPDSAYLSPLSYSNRNWGFDNI